MEAFKLHWIEWLGLALSAAFLSLIAILGFRLSIRRIWRRKGMKGGFEW